MRERLHNAEIAFKKVEHLVYVSLKYTRTVDMLRIVIENVILSLEESLIPLVKHLEEKKVIDDISEYETVSAKKHNLIRENFTGENDLSRYIDMINYLRKVLRTEYTKTQEFRRHVTMTVKFPDGKEDKIDIDRAMEYYKTTQELLRKVVSIVVPKE